MKNKFKIGILDDDSSKITQIIAKLIFGVDEINDFKNGKYINFEFEPIEIVLKNDLNEMVNQVIEDKIDCCIIDYKLSSYKIINFSGVEFASLLEETIEGFPIFILTSYEDDLFKNKIFNSYQVFNFNRYLNEKQERVEVNFKIIEQILKTVKQKENWENELEEMIEFAGTSASIDAKLIELDSKLERSINRKFSIPEKIKLDLTSNKITELIDKIDELLEKE